MKMKISLLLLFVVALAAMVVSCGSDKKAATTHTFTLKGASS